MNSSIQIITVFHLFCEIFSFLAYEILITMEEGLENKIFKSSVLDIKCSSTLSLTKHRDINKPAVVFIFLPGEGIG